MAAGACQAPPLPHALHELKSPDPGVREEAEIRIEALPDRERIPLLKRGLRGGDRELAKACALLLNVSYFSNEEVAPYITFLLSMKGEEDADYAFDAAYTALGSTEIDELLRSYEPRCKSDVSLSAMYGMLHRLLRADHIPLLCELVLGPDTARAHLALDHLRLLLSECDAHREVIARTLLARPYSMYSSDDKAREPRLGTVRNISLPNRRRGFPPLLHACLQHFFAENRIAWAHDQPETEIRDWLWRWVLATQAGADDRDLLMRLLGQDNYQSQLIALKGLRELKDRSLVDFLRKQISSKACQYPDYARLLLAELGDKKALKELEARAIGSSTSLCYLMQVSPSRAKPIALRDYLRQEYSCWPSQSLLDSQALREGTRLDYRLHLAWLQDHLLDAKIPLDTRLELLLDIRPFRTSKNAQIFADPEVYADLAKLPHRFEHYCALLEVLDRKALENLLVKLAETRSKEDRETALDVLLKLGSPSHDQMLIDYVNQMGRPQQLLGRTRTPAVRAHLIELSQETKHEQDALLGLLAHAGLTVDEFESDIPYFSTAEKELLLSGKAVDAIVAYLERQLEEDEFWAPVDLGKMKDPRLTALLLRRRKQKWRGSYLSMTALLVKQGLPSAVAEFREILRIGRYEWMDNIGDALLQHDLSITPRLIEELESSCCRNYRVEDWLCIFADQNFNSEGSETGAAIGRAWWKVAKENLHYSQIEERYIFAIRKK